MLSTEDKEEIKVLLHEKIKEVYTPVNKQLYAALVRAQATIKAVKKDSENTYQHYKYASAEDLIEEARKALGEHSLAVVQSAWAIDTWPPQRVESATSKGSAVQTTFIILVSYQLIHESGEIVEYKNLPMPAIIEPARPGDKALTTALTYSLGYFLRGLLAIPRGDGNPDDRNEDYGNKNKGKGNDAPPRNQPPQDRRPPPQNRPPANPPPGDPKNATREVSAEYAHAKKLISEIREQDPQMFEHAINHYKNTTGEKPDYKDEKCVIWIGTYLAKCVARTGTKT